MLRTHLLRTPYLLEPTPRVLVIGVGGGIDIMNAVWQGASHVTGAELQPITVKLLRGPLLTKWTGGVLARPEVELVASEGRHYVRSHDDRYDIVQITAVDTFSAQTTGAYVLAESYLYTVEAFQDYLSHLTDDGVLSIVVGDIAVPSTVPSAHAMRMALVAREALRRRGAADPQSHILLVADHSSRWSWGNLLVKRTPFTAEELRRVREFITGNGFVVRLAPGDPGDPAMTRLLDAPDAELDQLLRAADYAVDPVTDDRPFFFHGLKWRAVLGGLVTARKEFWFYPGSLTGQIMLVMMLGQALLVGGALIVLPLVRRGLGQLPRMTSLAFLAYFLGLGLGFLMIEISFVQKYVLILGYPTYSLSVTVCSLLMSAAAGAALCRRGWSHPRGFLCGLLAATVALVVLEGAAVADSARSCIGGGPGDSHRDHRCHPVSARNGAGHVLSDGARIVAPIGAEVDPLGLGRQRRRLGGRDCLGRSVGDGNRVFQRRVSGSRGIRYRHACPPGRTSPSRGVSSKDGTV